MSAPAVTPCRRPRVSVTREAGRKGHVARCEVDDCGWTYPRTDRGIALVSDAEYHARMHRAEHRAAADLEAGDR